MIKYVDGVPIEMTSEEIAAHNATLVFPTTIPNKVTIRQAKLALFQAGKLGDIETALQGLPEPDRSVALIEWTEATEVDRQWPLVLQMTPLIGTEADVDALFVFAATL